MRPALILALLPLPALAETPEVEAAWIEGNTVQVTLAHPDEGWDHYADAWEVFGPDGRSLGIRELAHPHVDEQPFTRSLTLDTVPDGPLTVRARCLVDGWGMERFPVEQR
jgi:hypothetical protein